jgi:hypothetical protein
VKNEAEFKRIFKKSVRAAKGFCLTLAAPMLSGIPDLYVIMPGYIPVLLEAKFMGNINKPTFNRKIPYSPLQVEWLSRCNDVYKHSALGLLGVIHQGKKYCILTQATQTHLSNNLEGNSAAAVEMSNKLFDIEGLFIRSLVPRLQPQHKDLLTSLDQMSTIGDKTNNSYINGK